MLDGKAARNFVQVLRLGGVSDPQADFEGAMADPIYMAPTRGFGHVRIIFRTGRGWQAATHFSPHPHAKYLHGGHGTTDAGLVGILRDRAVRNFQYAGVYVFVSDYADDPRWGGDGLKQAMEKVANSNKNWGGILFELRCRAPYERVPGGMMEECRVCAQGVAAHASRSNGGRWLLPVPFLDLVGMWVPMRGALGDTLPGCMAPLPMPPTGGAPIGAASLPW